MVGRNFFFCWMNLTTDYLAKLGDEMQFGELKRELLSLIWSLDLED